MNNLDKLLADMIEMGLAYTSSSWIEKAIEQRNERMTISLASSALLIYDEWDKIILKIRELN